MEDRDIVERYLRGDTDAYTTIGKWICDVVENHMWIASIPREDVCSSATEKILTNLRDNKFKYESSLKTYVQRITRYTIIDIVRSHQRTLRLLTLNNLEVNDVETPHDIFADKEEVQLFDKLFARISEKCRQLWNLLFVDNLTYKAVGALVGKSESAIKSQMVRCRDEAEKILALLK